MAVGATANVELDGFQCCSKGGKQIRKDTIQTPATIVLARRGVMMDRYLTGRVTATYLSTLIAHRFNIDAVDIQTSVTSQPRHQIWPNIQTSSICVCVCVWQVEYKSAYVCERKGCAIRELSEVLKRYASGRQVRHACQHPTN